MNRLLKEQQERIIELCRRLGVRRLDLFGSALTDRFDPASSDFDFLVEFDVSNPSDYADAWFSLREGLEALFSKPVDLITTSSLKNPYFAANVIATRKLVYAA